jgi:hypothetical protein
MSRPVSINPAPLAATAGAAALAVIGLQYAIARPEEDALREFLVVTGLIVVAAAIVFGVVVPRAVARGGSPGTALTLSLLGLVLAAAYWSGIPPVLAIGGIVLARRSQPGGASRAALVVGVLALVADLAVVVADGVGS